MPEGLSPSARCLAPAIMALPANAGILARSWEDAVMSGIDKRARLAGAIYLAASLPAFFSLMYVPDALIVSGDAAATFHNIVTHQTLFRWGIAAELAGFAAWVFVPLALYRLFADVDRTLATVMVILGLMTTPIMFANALSEMAVLTLVGDPRLAAAFPPQQLQALAALALRAHSQGFTLNGLFWGLWLFPFAALVWRSGFLPKFIAVLLSVAGVGWLVSSLTALVAPAALDAVRPIASLANKGELVTILWLIVMGARMPRSVAPSPASAGA
jgi:hypothetical protein